MAKYSMKPGSGVGGTGSAGTGKIFDTDPKKNPDQKSTPPMIVKMPVLRVEPKGDDTMYPGGSKDFDESTGKPRRGSELEKRMMKKQIMRPNTK
jgi:hypothetical protein